MQDSLLKHNKSNKSIKNESGKTLSSCYVLLKSINSLSNLLLPSCYDFIFFKKYKTTARDWAFLARDFEHNNKV